MEERLQKYLAECGIASRRKCEEYILQGKVKVNGKVITELCKKINEDIDIIEFEGNIVKKKNNKKVYILLNKPIGYVTTTKEQFGREKVLDLIKTNRRIVPVGRLDMYTSGALILTDDGDFVYKVTHPKHEIEKTYNVTVIGKVSNEEVLKLKNGDVFFKFVRDAFRQKRKNLRNNLKEYDLDKIENEYIVTVHGEVLDEEIDKLKNGIKIEDYITSQAKVKRIQYNPDKKQTRLVITIHEGKNRQVRKMCEAIGKKVIALHRSKIGDIDVKDIPLGKWRYLTEKEVKQILGE